MPAPPPSALAPPAPSAPPTPAGNHRLASPALSPSPSPTHSRPRLRLDVDARSVAESTSSKRLPSIPSIGSLPSFPGLSPIGRKGWALGSYDNKLVSSTLSHLPPLPPLSPSGMSSTGSSLSAFSSASQPVHAAPFASALAPQRSTPSAPSAGGVIVLPDGTSLPTGADGGRPERDNHPNMLQTILHSSPNSPWSLLTVHVLPVFAGSPLKTAIEDLNQLANAHIVAASQRTPASRLITVLTSDLRDFIASGMLTLKAKFETLEDAKVVSRAAEVWNFFWGQILPYVEGIFLPFSQIRDVPASSTSRALAAPIVSQPPIGVRHLVLSGFLTHILLPLLQRLVHLVGQLRPASEQGPRAGPGATDLPRLLQMSLVLSTQARYSSFMSVRDAAEAQLRDEESREAVEELGRAVRWSMAVVSGAITVEKAEQEQEQAEMLSESPLRDHGLAPSPPVATPGGRPRHARAPSVDRVVQRPGLQRGPSFSQAGRMRRRAIRGSISQLEPGPPTAEHQQLNHQPNQWGRPRIDEDDDEGELDATPQYNGAGVGAGRMGQHGMTFASGISGVTSIAPSTVGASTIRGGESLTFTDRTPAQHDYRRTRVYRRDSSGDEVVAGGEGGKDKGEEEGGKGPMSADEVDGDADSSYVHVKASDVNPNTSSCRTSANDSTSNHAAIHSSLSSTANTSAASSHASPSDTEADGARVTPRHVFPVPSLSFYRALLAVCKFGR
ncbi:hypothetical protein Q8F55_007481 [Vanrija albida]|uniref:HbrB-like protein n=1 Tax=Vanrija albida TaxID=181172 RepID=A0ABR3PTM1_9TREE